MGSTTLSKGSLISMLTKHFIELWQRRESLPSNKGVAEPGEKHQRTSEGPAKEGTPSRSEQGSPCPLTMGRLGPQNPGLGNLGLQDLLREADTTTPLSILRLQDYHRQGHTVQLQVGTTELVTDTQAEGRSPGAYSVSVEITQF